VTRPAPELPELLTPVEVAKMFAVHQGTVAKWADAGKLAVVRTPGGRRRYFADEVQALLNPPAPGGDR
jgi:excisionase family DNA binding protein